MEVGSSALMVDTSARVDIPAKNLQFHRFLHNNSKFYIRAPVFDLFERLNRLREGNREEYRLLKRGFRSPVLLLGGFPGSGKSTAVWTWMIQQVYKTNASAVFWLFSPENKGLYLRKPDSSSCSFIFTDLPKVLEAQRPDLVIVDGLTVEISSRSSNAMSPGAQVLRVIRNYLHDSKHALAVATTSREIHFSGTLAQDLQSLDFQKHTLPSWTLEDYVAAVELDEYYGRFWCCCSRNDSPSGLRSYIHFRNCRYCCRCNRGCEMEILLGWRQRAVYVRMQDVGNYSRNQNACSRVLLRHCLVRSVGRYQSAIHAKPSPSPAMRPSLRACVPVLRQGAYARVSGEAR
eukprot:m.50281 g.50281  ORF g.50281 m.50281 type:complete len:346 (+) comp6213_c0_seq1:196-1233(+)